MTSLTPALAAAGWINSDDGTAILKTFRFGNFRDALAWMMRIGLEAEDMDHHPEWFNVYNRVEVRLTTHEIGGLSDKDIDLATRMEALAS